MSGEYFWPCCTCLFGCGSGLEWIGIEYMYRTQNPIAHQKKSSGYSVRMNSTLHVLLYPQPLQFIVANSIFVLAPDQLLCVTYSIWIVSDSSISHNNKKKHWKNNIHVMSDSDSSLFFRCLCVFSVTLLFVHKTWILFHILRQQSRMKFIRRCWLT